MKHVLIVIFLICSIFEGNTQTANHLFEGANKLYQNKEYEQASVLYDSILKMNVESAELYYNLGNCYYKLNRNASAILNYERALKLSPDDEDILFNLRLANLRIADKIDPIDELFFINWWKQLTGTLSSASWSTVCIILIWLVFLSFTVFIITRYHSIKKISFFIGLLLCVSSFFTLLFAWQQYQSETKNKYAIVFADNAYIKSAPDESSTDLFILHEGIKVEILDQIGEWIKIKIADGNVGWIEKTSVQSI